MGHVQPCVQERLQDRLPLRDIDGMAASRRHHRKAAALSRRFSRTEIFHMNAVSRNGTRRSLERSQHRRRSTAVEVRAFASAAQDDGNVE